MRRFLLVLWLIYLVFVPAYTQAQDEGWPVVERCAAPAIEPPEDWQFDGTILLAGWAGLHGIQADLNTPYVIAFIDWNVWAGGRLSPDGHRLVVTQEEATYIPREAAPVPVQVHAFRVYDTTNGKSKTIPWDATYTLEPVTGDGHYYFEQSVKWWDNEHLLYAERGSTGIWNDDSLVIIDAVTGAVEVAPPYLDKATWLLVPDFLYAASPDWTRLVVKSIVSTQYSVVDLTSGEVLYPKDNNQTIRLVRNPSWRSDSEKFLIHHASDNGFDIFLYDRDANPVEYVYSYRSQNEFYLDYIPSNTWSLNDRYFALKATLAHDSYWLYVADTEQRVIWDTCLQMYEYESVAWSPDGNKLAFVGASEGNRPIRVIDLTDWTVHTVAYHSGYLIGWRADD